MPNHTQSPAETKLYVPKPGEKVRITAVTYEYSGNKLIKVDDVLTVRLECGVGGAESKVAGYVCLHFEEHRDGNGVYCRVSPAAAVSDLCDACGKPCGPNPYTRHVIPGYRGHEADGAKFCKVCENHGFDENTEAVLTRRRSLAEPGFKVGDEVEWDEADNARHSGEGEVGIGHGRISEMIDARDMRVLLLPSGNLGCGDGAFWHVDPKAKSLRLIRRAPTEAARTGEVWEPKVGEMCEGEVAFVRKTRIERGRFERYGDKTAPDLALLIADNGSREFVTRASLRPLPPATAGGEQVERCGDCSIPLGFGIHGKCNGCLNKGAEQPKLDASGFLDRAYLDEQREKAIPSRDAARLKVAMPSKHHQALAQLSAPLSSKHPKGWPADSEHEGMV